MSGVMEARAQNPVRDAMRRVDWDACVSASAWPVPSPDGFPAPFDGFDLMPHRAAHIAARRRRSVIGWIVAIGSGLLGAAILHWHAANEQRASSERHETLTRRLAAFAPGLAERQRLEASLTVAAEHDAKLAALAPHRQQVIALLDAVEQAAQDGVAVTAMTREDEPTHHRGLGGGGIGGVGSAGDSEGGDRRDDAALIRVVGLADDADAVARWSGRLTAHPAIERIELDALRRLADPANAASGLNVFRMTVRMAPLSGSAQTSSKPASAATAPARERDQRMPMSSAASATSAFASSVRPAVQPVHVDGSHR